jgi:hypothetical protein
MCEKRAKSGWREMSGGGGEIDSPVESPVEYPLPTFFLCHMSKEVT